MATKKRPYAQDFSGPSLTDKSFAPACDVNNIVRHYQQTGLDPHIERKKLETYGVAPTQSFSEAMRNKAELDSIFASLPDSVRAQHANNSTAWFEYLGSDEASQELLDAMATPPAEPAPQGASVDETEA